MRIRVGTFVLAALAFVLGGVTASAVTLVVTFVVHPAMVETPAGVRCHVEWGWPTEKVCEPIQEDSVGRNELVEV